MILFGYLHLNFDWVIREIADCLCVPLDVKSKNNNNISKGCIINCILFVTEFYRAQRQTLT